MELTSYSTLQLILNIDDKLSSIFELKELYIHFNRTSSYEEAIPNINKIIAKSWTSNIIEMVEIAKTLYT